MVAKPFAAEPGLALREARCHLNNLGSVQHMAEAHANLNVKDGNGMTPL
jgi:hypothetical protein